MAMTRYGKAVAYCILCIEPVFGKAPTGLSEPQDHFAPVKKHYKKWHPEVFDKRFRH